MSLQVVCFLMNINGDHSKSVKEILKLGVNTYMSKGTCEALKLQNPYLNVIDNLKSFYVGSYKVIPFDVQHDCNEPLGFYIKSMNTGESILFATDTYFIKYKFPKVNYYMLESNYSLDILNDNVSKGYILPFQKKRVLNSHFSIDNVVDYLSKCDLAETKTIYLLHLSNGNSDEEEFKNKIRYTFFKECIVF